MERFEKSGIPYEMVEDRVVIAGPSWLDFGLNYTQIYDENDNLGKLYNKISFFFFNFWIIFEIIFQKKK